MLKGKKFDAFALNSVQKSPFRSLECPFRDSEWPFRDLECPFRDLERRI